MRWFRTVASEIDSEHYDWEAGDAVHVPPKMTRHEHFNPSDARTRTLRIEYGIHTGIVPVIARQGEAGDGALQQVQTIVPSGSIRGVLSVMPPPVICAAPRINPASCNKRIGFK